MSAHSILGGLGLATSLVFGGLLAGGYWSEPPPRYLAPDDFRCAGDSNIEILGTGRRIIREPVYVTATRKCGTRPDSSFSIYQEPAR